MSEIEFLLNGDDPGRATLLLAHGAGAAMDTPVMTTMAEALAARGLRVARFEFAYMAGRRSGGPKRPPPKIELLQEEFRKAIGSLVCSGPLFIGGKSMGGRVASMIADELWGQKRIRGLVCLGYPFHPPAKPEKLRTGQLAGLHTPALICQGTRDPFGTQEEAASYTLSDAVTFCWLEDGDHDLKPRKKVTGLTQGQHLESAADEIARWIEAAV